jgi:hypothetical protein
MIENNCRHKYMKCSKFNMREFIRYGGSTKNVASPYSKRSESIIHCIGIFLLKEIYLMTPYCIYFSISVEKMMQTDLRGIIFIFG